MSDKKLTKEQLQAVDYEALVDAAEDISRFCAEQEIPIRAFTLDIDTLADIGDPEVEYSDEDKIAIFDELTRRAYCMREGIPYTPDYGKGYVKATLRKIARLIDIGLRSHAKSTLRNRKNGTKGGRPAAKSEAPEDSF